MTVDDMLDILITFEIASEEAIHLVTCINGYSKETMLNILYAQTGYRDFETFLEVEDNTLYVFKI